MTFRETAIAKAGNAKGILSPPTTAGERMNMEIYRWSPTLVGCFGPFRSRVLQQFHLLLNREDDYVPFCSLVGIVDRHVSG